jgi:hypothetical protein
VTVGQREEEEREEGKVNRASRVAHDLMENEAPWPVNHYRRASMTTW